jgi:hypothetical protein
MPEYDAGEPQAAKAPVSSEHSNVESSLAKNPITAVVAVVGFGGPELTVTVGAVVSTVQVYEAGVASVPPTVVERTWNECAPSLRPEYDFGVAQLAKTDASSLHSNVADGAVDVNENWADVELEAVFGLAVIVVSSGPVTTQVYATGTASKVPPGPIACTWNVCEPPPSDE